MKLNDRWQKILAGLLVVFLLACTLYAIYEPAWRAERVYQAIKQGESFDNVESRLSGRHFCLYYVMTTEGWKTLSSRSEFSDAMKADSTEALRLHVAFLGVSPYRVSLDVEFDRSGNVTSVAKPYGWD